MKKGFFIVLFFIFTLFPVHLVYESKTSNSIVLNSAAKTVDTKSDYKLLIDRINNKILVYKNNKNESYKTKKKEVRLIEKSSGLLFC